MPTVVYPNAHPITTAIQGLTGVAQGVAEANKFTAEQDQQNATRQQAQLNADRGRADASSQFDRDMAFRIQSLEAIRAEKGLDRETEAKLAVMKEIFAGKRLSQTQEFEGGQNQAERAKDVKITGMNNAVQYKNIDEQKKASLREFSINKQKLVDDSVNFNLVQAARAKYGEDVTKWTDQQKDEAFATYLQKSGTPGETTGKEGIPQLTPEEIATKRTDFLDRALKAPQEWKGLQTRAMDIAKAEAAGKFVTGTTEGGKFALSDHFDIDPKTKTAKLDPVSQFPLLKVDGTALQGYKSRLNDMEGLILSQAIMAQYEPNPASYSQHDATYEAFVDGELAAMTDIPTDTKVQLKAYYMDQMSSVLEKIAQAKAKKWEVEVDERGVHVTDPTVVTGSGRIGVE